MKVAQSLGIKKGTRLAWEVYRHQKMVAHILPDSMAGLREAQNIAAKNKEAATQLMRTFEEERMWERKNTPLI